MNYSINRDERFLIPKWRSFDSTVQLGELEYNSNGYNSLKSKDEVENKISEWHNIQDKASALELVTISKIYFLDDELKYSKDIIDANNFLKSFDDENLVSKIIDDAKQMSVDAIRNNILTINKIRNLKKKISIFSKNPIDWANLSYYYTILNQKEKAVRSMMIALSFNKNNRYIIRAAVRLFIHYGMFDSAYDILKKSQLTFIDPWVNSAYIAVSQLCKKPITKIKESLVLLNSENIHPFNITELASSLAMLEFKEGNDKKGKKNLKKSIISPNDNSAAQLQWISKNYISLPSFEEELTHIEIKNNYEHDTLLYCYMQDFDKAVEEAEKWKEDESYSDKPNDILTCIYNTIYKDYSRSESLATDVLKIDPNNLRIKYSLIYSLIKQRKYESANQIMNEIRTNNQDSTQIILLADEGLIKIMNGQIEEGRNLYEQAIKMSNEKNLDYLKISAITHLAMEEKILNTEQKELAINRAKKEINNTNDPLIKNMINSL